MHGLTIPLKMIDLENKIYKLNGILANAFGYKEFIL